MSLGALLREVGALAPFARFVVGPGADSRQVTLSLDGVPLPVALIEMLKAADIAYVFAGGSGSGAPFRLVADVVDVAEAGTVVATAPVTAAASMPRQAQIGRAHV